MSVDGKNDLISNKNNNNNNNNKLLMLLIEQWLYNMKSQIDYVSSIEDNDVVILNGVSVNREQWLVDNKVFYDNVKAEYDLLK